MNSRLLNISFPLGRLFETALSLGLFFYYEILYSRKGCLSAQREEMLIGIASKTWNKYAVWRESSIQMQHSQITDLKKKTVESCSEFKTIFNSIQILF